MALWCCLFPKFTLTDILTNTFLFIYVVLWFLNSLLGFSISYFNLHLWFGRVFQQPFEEASPWPRRRQWHPTPVLLPGKSHGWRSLVGCSPWVEKSQTDWATSLSLFTFMHWRRKWQPTPLFLPGESQGRGSLVGCPLWGHTESDTTEVT